MSGWDFIGYGMLILWAALLTENVGKTIVDAWWSEHDKRGDR